MSDDTTPVEGTSPDEPSTDAVRVSRWQALRDSPLGSVVVLAVTALVVLGGVWVVNAVRGHEGATVELAFEAKPVKVGQEAPGFTATTIDGQKVRLEDLRGRPVWLVFGTTWCSTCRSEAATIEAVHNARDDVVIVAVYVGEKSAQVSRFAEQLGLTYLQVADPDTRLGSTYRASALPRHVLVDADGTVRRVDIGAVDQATANARLDELVAG
ncbi:MAG: TlpA family protein disulfide reductase [Micrococcales bacterium]|nr:TlpA family protein disulfide reductase [Micrococcales bacterium]